MSTNGKNQKLGEGGARRRGEMSAPADLHELTGDLESHKLVITLFF